MRFELPFVTKIKSGILCILIAIFLSACGGIGSGSSAPFPVSGSILGVLPTGSTVYVNESNINAVNLATTSATLSVTGGATGVNYLFTFNVMPSIPTVSPNSCMITTGTKNNSCTITFNPNFAGNGNYNVTVNYNMLNSNNTSAMSLKSESVNNTLPNPIQLTLSGSTQVRLISPTATESVGVGTPIMVQFNNPIESNTVNESTFLLLDSTGNKVTAQSIYVTANNESAVFIVTNSFQNPLQINETYNVQVTNGVHDLTDAPINESTFTFSTQKRAYHVFLTESSFNGNLLDTANGLQSQVLYTNGVDAADYLCQRDRLRPNNANYKALIVDGFGLYRNAAPIPLNWIMQPFAQYNNSTESMLFITGINPSNASPIYLSVSSVTFNSTWLNRFAVRSQLNFYDGLIQNWTSSQNSCQSWTSSSASATQYYGTYFSSSPIPTSAQISSGYDACNGSATLFCVEQP